MTTKTKVLLAGIVLFLVIIVVWKIIGANSSGDVRRQAAASCPGRSRPNVPLLSIA